MPDYYVNSDLGSDDPTNPGTSRSAPLRTISRATDLAAIEDLSSGTIFLAEGTYGSLEDFPIEVPPRFALQGEGTADACRIEYSGGLTGVAVQGGASVRNLSVVATPPPDTPLSCNFSIGLSIRQDGCVLENLGIKLNESDPDDSVGFGVGLYIEGADATASRIEVERSDIHASECNSTISRCNCTRGWIGVGGDGNMRVENCTLHSSRLTVSECSQAEIVGNWLNGGGISISGNGRTSGDRPVIRNNVVNAGTYEALVVRGQGNELIQGNIISAGHRTVSLLEGATPFLLNNQFELRNLSGDSDFRIDRLLWIAAGRSSGPGFQGNLFDIGPNTYLFPMWIRNNADFGGGIHESDGLNTFRLQPGQFLDFNVAGHFYARNNYWNILPPQTKKGPDTTVDTEGGRLDPERYR